VLNFKASTRISMASHYWMTHKGNISPFRNLGELLILGMEGFSKFPFEKEAATCIFGVNQRRVPTLHYWGSTTTGFSITKHSRQ